MTRVDDLLAAARERLVRPTPQQAAAAQAAGALLVDLRLSEDRAAEGEIPGSVVVHRNYLEWRLDPTGEARLPQAGGGPVVLFCNEGYTSSLAAVALRELGLDATDLDGGFRAWRAAGLPWVAGPTPLDTVVPG